MNGIEQKTRKKNILLPFDINPDNKPLTPNDVRWFRHFFISFHAVEKSEIEKTISDPQRRHDLGQLATDSSQTHNFRLWQVNKDFLRRHGKKRNRRKLNKLIAKETKQREQKNQYVMSASPARIAELMKMAEKEIPLFPDTEIDDE